MERTKKEWIDWANEQGFTKEDAKRALANLSGTIDEIEASRAFFQFAGDELKKRQAQQRAAKGQVTKVKKENRLLNDKLNEVEKQYEGVLSSILGKLSFIYSWAVPKGLEPDEEIEEVLETEYKNNPKKAA
jgi:hypothetical protein